MTDPVGFNYTSWFQNEMPSWTPKDTQVFFGHLFSALGTQLSQMTSAVERGSAELKEAESESN